MDLQPHQQRVVEERDALKVKIDALEKFMHSPIYEGLEFGEKVRLQFQFLFMSQYHMVLGQRINAFTTPATQGA